MKEDRYEQACHSNREETPSEESMTPGDLFLSGDRIGGKVLKGQGGN